MFHGHNQGLKPVLILWCAALRRSIKTFYHKYHVRHLAIIQQTTPEDGLVDNTVTAIIYLHSTEDHLFAFPCKSYR